MEPMLLILTHENGDFDAIASQLGAYKLYPHAIPLLPRRINRNVLQFLTLYWDTLPYVRPQEWQKRRVDELLLVDTQSLSSVRGLVKRPKVLVIDHHVSQAEETAVAHRPNWTYQVEAVGATTTLLVERLRASGLTLAADEATLLLLGIYEDTGSLTYDTTTGRDAQAAAWLLDQGAVLPVVRRFLNVPLTAVQRDLYESLQTSVQWQRIHGQTIVIATAVAPPNFDDEISSVVHRLRDALSPAGLFALVQLGRDVQLVARSNRDAVDVSRIARALGGGGHSRAAAAMIVARPLADVLAELISLLPQAVEPMARVAQIMSYGVQTLHPTTTVAEAAVLMQRFGYEGYPVVEPETREVVGLLTRRGVDRAISHDLGRFPVTRVMKQGNVTVRPSDSIERVQQLMLDEGWGQIPVVADPPLVANNDEKHAPSYPIGVVTRTDLLNFLFQTAPNTDRADIKTLLNRTLAAPLWAMVLAVSAEAAEMDMPLYFVGGVVRDLLLGHAPTDMDMVVEGDGIALVRRLQTRFGGEVHTHRRFGTGKWFVSDDVWRQVLAAFWPQEDAGETAVLPPHLPVSIDFVTARTEFYMEPSALPQVERGSIKLDLHRRDFTINTLAVRLDGAHLGELLDFYGGRKDLQQGLIRVLHSLSFIDDPTRILRAVRYEARLKFTIEPRTAELLADGLPMLDRVTGDRIRHELELALREQAPAAVMARLWQLGVLRQIHPALRWGPETAVAYTRVPIILADPVWRAALPDETPVFLYFALTVLPLEPAEQTVVMSRLRVRKATREDVAAVARLLDALASLPAAVRQSELAFALRPFLPRVLLTVRLALTDEVAIGRLEWYFREGRMVETAVSGDDLRQMGLKPGPQFGILLDRLLAARLDGAVTDEAGERALLARLLADERAPARGNPARLN
ncbi:MAG: CBS domain-containing protein [Chloroflexi bacterium]|nr:CBS domain-containing protein [Chloroflexota bacterium]